MACGIAIATIADSDHAYWMNASVDLLMRGDPQAMALAFDKE